jgi:galactosyl transferase GMA12/MNN10 family
MAVTLVCYAAGPRYHERNQLALITSAKNKGIDRIIAYSPLDGSHPFYQQHRRILERPTGAGFWLWKPYIIAETLKHLGPDEIVFYLDSDARVQTHLSPLLRELDRHDLLLFENSHSNLPYTKRDCFLLMGADDPFYHHSTQLDAAFLGFRNTPRTRDFVDQWLHHCTDERILSELPNQCGRDNDPAFIAHRYDQSVLSLLYLKRRQELDAKLLPHEAKSAYLRHHQRKTLLESISALRDRGLDALDERLRRFARRLTTGRES